MDTSANDNEVLYEVHEGVGLVTFNRPQARNALTFAMYDRLADICSNASNDATVNALILTGAGERAFAAGTDISRFREFDGADDAINYEHRMDAVLGALECCTVPTIAALSGACTGGGGAIAACCDLRIASRNLKFGFPIARTLGNCLSTATLSRLVTLIGSGRVRELLFTARLVGADEAYTVGLVSELHEDHAALMARAFELAAEIGEFAPLTLRATKESLRRMRLRMSDGDDSDLVTLCYTSEDFREGLESFLAKRKPVFKGR